ncbi:unnamed protein product [Rodentolepis nana]|uniref:Btz domain-containing protein n=1 Tax=Rodentolepis nana TaxID=102285 RepID=A0A0R3TWZ8_RODNA|nr:unnamed protein product [Rodentolepis nana]
MDAERSDNADSADEDPGIVQVYAGNVVGAVKTSSPTSDALDSAEALLRERQLQKHQYSDSRSQPQSSSQFRHEAWSVGHPPSYFSSRHPHEGMYHAHSYHNYHHRHEFGDPGSNLRSIRSQYYYPRRNRSGRNLRATRSMSDENDWFGARGQFNRFPYSTESTESEHQPPSAPLFASAKSAIDMRSEEMYRRGGYVCRWHRASPLRQYTNSRVPMLRRSKSLGRPNNSALISSSSNDEGISKAYFRRLKERELSRDQFNMMENSIGRRLTRSRRHMRIPFDGSDFPSEWDQKDVFRSDRMKMGKSPSEKLTSKHWLQKITSVPEIQLTSLVKGESFDIHTYMGSVVLSEHQLLTDSPRFRRRFNENIQKQRDRQQQYQQNQRRGRSWREENELHNRVEPEEDAEFLDDEEFGINQLEYPDDAPLDWPEGLAYTPSANPRNRRLRHSDPIGRNAKSMDLAGRGTSGPTDKDYRTKRAERKTPKGGKNILLIQKG